MEEKKNKGLVIAVILLVVCVLGLGGFIVYDKVLKKEPAKPVENRKDNEPIVENEKDNEPIVENEKEDIEVSSPENFYDTEFNKLGKELLKRYSMKYMNAEYYFYNLNWYETNKLDESNMDFQLQAAFEHLDSKKIKWLSTLTDQEYIDKCLHELSEDEYEYTCYYMSIKKADFEAAYSDLFGTSLDYSDYYVENSKRFFLDIMYECEVIEDEIKCGNIPTGDTVDYGDFVRFSSARMNEDILEVVADFISVEKYYNVETDNDVNELFKKNKDDFKKILIKFEKNDDGKYYWMSTEKFITE